MSDKQQKLHKQQEEYIVQPEETAHVNSSSGRTFTEFMRQRKFALLFIFFILLMIAAVSVRLHNPMQQQPTGIKKTVITQKLVKRSRDLGLIYRGLTGKAIDVTTGKIVKAARIFSLNDNAVYLEVDLNNAPKGLVINVLRYKGGKYVSNDEITVSATNTQNVLFSWKINASLAKLRDGNWKAVTYANGILAKRFTYIISAGNVFSVYPDQPISVSDPDYRLRNVLAARNQNH